MQCEKCRRRLLWGDSARIVIAAVVQDPDTPTGLTEIGRLKTTMICEICYAGLVVPTGTMAEAQPVAPRPKSPMVQRANILDVFEEVQK